MALDELKENDEVFEVGGHKYVIEKELLAQATPITVDFNETGFKIDAALDLGESGCGGCGSAGSC